MDLSHFRCLHQVAHVVAANTTTGQYHDALSPPTHQAGELLLPFGGSRRAARREHALRA